MVSFAEDTFPQKTIQIHEYNDESHISFATGTKLESSAGLIGVAKGNEIVYHIGMLKVGFVYKTRLELLHKFDEQNYEILIPFKHTTNITLLDASKSDDGHQLLLQIHPQKPLFMNDHLDIEFMAKSHRKPQEQQTDIADFKDVEDETNSVSSNSSKISTHKMKLKITAKVLRKEQGTPMLKQGVTCVTKGALYTTDVSATEWE